MSSNLNWAQPIYGADVQTSQAYLQRLQEFLAAQSGGSGDNQVNGSNAIASSSESNKRKNPGDNASTSAASKDRRQSGGRASADGTHTHVDQADRDDRSESPEQTSSTKKKGSTTSDKRKEQNRNAQRAFRERKEKVLKDLEEKIEGLNKVNDQQSSENKNLRELVDRLQQENARLQQAQNNQPPAPQSDFTFRSQPAPSSNPSSSAVPYQSGSATSDGPASLTDQDILAFLNQPAPVFPQQSAYTMIQPSPQGSQSGSGSSEDWLWNASTFGTEIPQAIPLDVTNLAESSRSPNNNAIFPWADLSANTASTGNFSASGPISSNPNYASYLTGFPSFNTDNAASQSVSQTASQQGHSSRSASQTHTSASRSSTDGTSGKAGSRNGGTTAESPETTCSSSGSDPSDALPATPSSAPFPYISSGQDGQIDFAAMFGQSQSGFGDLKASPYSFLTSPGLQGSGMVKTETPQTSFFGSMQATTPSAIFDSLNYRDPLLADLDDNGNRSTDLLANLDNKNENFDLSDFLVASPPSQQGASAGPSPPAFLHHSSSGSTQSGYASSSGSVPTMGSQAYPKSTSSGQSSSAASPQANMQGQVTLPYNMTYGHPLASYVLQSMQGKSPSQQPQQQESVRQPWQQYADQIMQGCKQKAFEDEVQKRQAKGGVMDAHDLDSLCKDMQVKATCQEMIRKKVQDSMDSDQEMMELYKKYMQDGQKA